MAKVPTKTDYTKLLNRMTDAHTTEVTADFLGMFYGESGVGKTRFIAALSQRLRGDGLVLWFDTSKGFVSLRGDKLERLRRGVKRIEVESYDDIPNAIAAVRAKYRDFADVKVVVIDELNSLADEVLERLLREKLGLGDKEIPDVVPDWAQYYPQKELIRRAVQALDDLSGVHVILGAHEESRAIQIAGQEKKISRTSAAFSPKLYAQVKQRLHLLARMTARAGRVQSGEQTYRREFQCQPTMWVDAKTRIDGLGLHVTAKDVADAISAWVTDPTTPEILDEPESEVEILPDDIPDDAPLEDDSDFDEPAFEGELAN